MKTLLKLNSLRLLMAVVAVVLLGSLTYSCSDGGSANREAAFRIVDIDTVSGRNSLDTVTAESWLLVDATTGYPICGKDWNRRLPPASLTKMMTCILALEQGEDKMDDTIRITEDVYVAKNSRVRLNDTYLMKNLLMEMMMLSDNDAAFAIAKHIAGDTLKFCKMMNRKARELNMTCTHFANPNGIPNNKNYSTAQDLIRLITYCMRDPCFARIVGTLEADIPLADGRHLPCKNTNRLLEEYEGCIGVKTGFINASGGCLAVAARRDGVTLYLVMLKSRYGRRFSEAPIILDFGFNVAKAVKDNLSEKEEEDS